MSTPRIKTTVVGSYPVPDWLAALPSEQALLDATRVVIATQEEAGIDVVCDGELYRFDVNHPETNGMIEYFVRPLDGVRTRMSFDELFAYRAGKMGFRGRPPGVVEGPIGAGTLALPDACARAKRLATRPFKFTLTGPHMLAKTLVDRHYKSTAELALAIADVLAAQVKHLDAEVVQVDEANLPGAPDEWEWAAAADQPRARRGEDDARGAPLLRQLRRPVAAARHLGEADELSERAARGPRGAGVRAPAARGAGGVQGAAPRDRHGPRRRRHQAHRDRVGGDDRARDRGRRTGDRSPAA